MPWARAASSALVSQGSIGARPGTKRARVSLARSLVPMTKQARRVAGSRAARAMHSTSRMASGVSIIAQSAIERSAPRAVRRLPISTSVPGSETLGTRMALGQASAAAARSASNQGVPGPLTRITSSLRP